jgi:hypothetical protein
MCDRRTHKPGCAWDRNKPPEVQTDSCVQDCPIGGHVTRDRLLLGGRCPRCTAIVEDCRCGFWQDVIEAATPPAPAAKGEEGGK